jgi:Sigma-70, region 4
VEASVTEPSACVVNAQQLVGVGAGDDVLLLRDTAGFPAAEVAAILGITEAEVNGALRRARATMAAHLPGPGRERPPLPRSPREHELARRFAAAYTSDDINTLVSLLTGDACYTMPPVALEYAGRPAIASFLRNSARQRGG